MNDPTKLTITAYAGTGDKPQLSTSPDDVYTALVNPETYVIKHTVNWSTAVTTGTPQDPKYISTPPPSYQFDFLFDSVAGHRQLLGCILDEPQKIGNHKVAVF